MSAPRRFSPVVGSSREGKGCGVFLRRAPICLAVKFGRSWPGSGLLFM
jgi:hypothetical protein